MSEIIYVVHPVTAEQKRELLKKGKIIDAKFAGKGDKTIDPNRRQAKAKDESEK